MPPVLRNILATLAGFFVGGTVDMAIILLGGALLPPPAGVNVNDIASINAHIHEYSVLQMMVPFLAHALGTLVGAFVAVKLAASRRPLLATIIGAIRLLSGLYVAVRMIPNAPMWFDVLDLAVAYLPMAWLGARLGTKR